MKKKTVDMRVDTPREFRHQDEYDEDSKRMKLYSNWEEKESMIYELLENFAKKYGMEFTMSA